MSVSELSPSADKKHVVTAFSRHQNTSNCRSFYRTIRALMAQGYIVHCISAGDIKLTDPQFILHRAPLPVRVRAGMLFWTLFYFSAGLEMIRVLRANKVSAFFFTRTHYSFLAGPLSLVFRVPITLQLTSVPSEVRALTVTFAPKRWFLNAVDYLGMKAASLVVVPSEALRLALSGSSGAREIRVLTRCVPIPDDVRMNGSEHIDAESWRNWMNKFISRRRELAETYSVPEKCFFLASSIEYASLKNLELLVRSVSATESERLALFVWGENSGKNYLQSMAVSLGLYDRVVFVEGSSDLVKLISACDLLVQPSTSSGNSELLREALGCGTPVLAAESGEAEELLESKELLFRPQHVQTLADRLQTILGARSELDQLRRTSRERGLELMSNWGKDLAQLM